MNKFYHGDCLFVMNHDIEPESVDLIYLDPPFFTGKVQKGTAKWTPEAMEVSYEDSKKFWGDTDKIKDMRIKAPDWLSYIATQRADFASYLYYMMERLQACHKVLKPTGSIYLHCDEKASHYLKMLMDIIFGYNNFRNEIIWCYKSGSYPKIGFAKKHDSIFRYSKSNTFFFNASSVKKELSKSTITRYNKTDSDGRKYAHVCSKGKWRDYYLDEADQVMEDYWVDIPMLKGNYTETVGYPTQKPLTLLKRIIKASSNDGDIILDPFCGCGTAIIATEQLNQEAHNLIGTHGKPRKWIGIDINKDAYEVTSIRQGEFIPEDYGCSYVTRNTKEAQTLKPDVFEKWVNEYYKATKPMPDKGVDGIMTDGTPIQTKTFLVKYPTLSEFITNAKLHPNVPKPIKKVIVVSQIGFHEGATKRQFEIEKLEGIKVELHTPEDMLKI